MPRLDHAEAYIDALVKEWEIRRQELHEPVSTLYIGGGTPSILPVELLHKLLTGIGVHDFSLEEFTIEANPEDVTSAWMAGIVSAGVNRVSMGVQSLIDKELVAIGRRHTAQQALTAIDTIRSGGISNISCDLIYGLPFQTIDTWAYSLDTLLSRQLSHLSAYLLSYEKGTRLYAQLMTGKVTEASDEQVCRMYEILVERASIAGMNHYEISNFGLPGLHSRHNSNYWNSTPYLGLGVSAHSFDGHTRRYNPLDMSRYMESPGNVCVVEETTCNTVHNDKVITALRTSEGLNQSELNHSEMKALYGHVRSGAMVEVANGQYRIDERSWLLADAIMTDFIRVD